MIRYDQNDRKRLAALKRRVARVRDFPRHTCPASRHLHMMADALSGKRGEYPMLSEEPDHCAESIYAVLFSLWITRARFAKAVEDLADLAAHVGNHPDSMFDDRPLNAPFIKAVKALRRLRGIW